MLQGKFMQKLFFWIGIFLLVSDASCASVKSSHKKAEPEKSEMVAQKHEEKEDQYQSVTNRAVKVEQKHPQNKNHDKASTNGRRGAHWSYKGKTGPNHWGSLEPEYKACRSGREQSPIDITRVKMKTLSNIRFYYKSSNLNIINNGHTIQVNTDRGSSIRINGEKYDLVQFHFHTPSEHTIEGSRYPMEMHLVHKNKKGALAVVGVMMVVGRHNRLLESLWDNLPYQEGKESLKERINLAELLPAGEQTFRYPGSLTTPPCSEGVKWNILLAPIAISNEQLTAFRDIFENNSRPVQPTRKRVVWHDTTP